MTWSRVILASISLSSSAGWFTRHQSMRRNQVIWPFGKSGRLVLGGCLRCASAPDAYLCLLTNWLADIRVSAAAWGDAVISTLF